MVGDENQLEKLMEVCFLNFIYGLFLVLEYFLSIIK